MSLDPEQPAETLDSTAEIPANTSTDPDYDGTEQVNNLQSEPEEIEEELEGVKLRGKKELLEKLKGERLMQADYTRKTQEVAEQRKAIEAERERVAQAMQFQQANIREFGRLHDIEDRLGQLQRVDWQTLNTQDPVRAQSLLIEFNQLQSARTQLHGSITQRQQQQALQMQQVTAKQLQEGRAVLEREIKGWSPELAGKLTEYGEKLGFPRQILDQITQPAPIIALYKAWMFDQTQQQAQAAKPPPKPASRVSGNNASNQKPLSEVTDPREWAERRRQWKSRNRNA